MPLTLVLIAALVAFGTILVYLLYCVALRTRSDEADAGWLQSFSVDRYRPINRMLAASDYEFLKRQGVSKQVIRRLRGERREICRIYIKNVVRDFNRLHWAAQSILVASEADQPELAARLVRTRAEFQRNVFLARVRLSLDAVGLGGLDAGTVLNGLETLTAEFHTLAASHIRSAAQV